MDLCGTDIAYFIGEPGCKDLFSFFRMFEIETKSKSVCVMDDQWVSDTIRSFNVQCVAALRSPKSVFVV